MAAKGCLEVWREKAKGPAGGGEVASSAAHMLVSSVSTEHVLLG